MQQAYSAIRLVSEAATVRIVLSTHPDELVLKELSAACASFKSQDSEGIKALVLDFRATEQAKEAGTPLSPQVERAYHALRAVTQPVLAVARASLSLAACRLLAAADLALVAHDAQLAFKSAGEGAGEETLQGEDAARRGYVTWSTPHSNLSREMERILNMLREKSAVALRHAKTGARIGQSMQEKQSTPLEALQLINTLYLAEVMQTQDSAEGLNAFLEKRKPTWKNK